MFLVNPETPELVRLNSHNRALKNALETINASTDEDIDYMTSDQTSLNACYSYRQKTFQALMNLSLDTEGWSGGWTDESAETTQNAVGATRLYWLTSPSGQTAFFHGKKSDHWTFCPAATPPTFVHERDFGCHVKLINEFMQAVV